MQNVEYVKFSEGRMFFEVLGKLTKLGKKDVPMIVDTKNAEFTGHKAI